MDKTFPGGDDDPIEVELVEIPVYAFPLFAFKKLAKLLWLDLPNVRVGSLLECFLSWEMNGKIPYEIGPKITSVVHSGRKRFDVFVRGDNELVKWSLNPVQVIIEPGVIVREN